MFRKVDGKIMRIGNKFPFRKVNILTFQVEGDRFPIQEFVNIGIFYFDLTKETNVIVNWGDGVSEIHTTTPFGENHRFGYRTDSVDDSNTSRLQPHIFQDGFTGRRNITFEFEDLGLLYRLFVSFLPLHGSVPIEISFANNIEFIYFSRTNYLDDFPEEINSISSLRGYDSSNAFLNTQTVIPDPLFSSNLERLNISGYNLADNTSSNFFKINQLSSTLSYFEGTVCNIQELPNELFECLLLSELRVSANNFKKVDERINQLTNLNKLYFGNVDVTVDNGLPNFNNLNELTVINLAHNDTTGSGFNYSDIVNNWVGLKSLSNLLLFQNFCRTNTQFNIFINAFYTLCTNEAYINQAAIPAGDPYPNRFKNIAWGHGSLSFSGTKQAPQGYVQGVSNGTPANEGEKVYVMQNQYGHTITHA